MNEDTHCPAPAREALVPAPSVPVERRIVVNGRPTTFFGDRISHGQLVRLAHPGAHADASRSFAVVYRGGPVEAAEGILSPLRSVPVAEGESFSVAVADRS